MALFEDSRLRHLWLAVVLLIYQSPGARAPVLVVSEPVLVPNFDLASGEKPSVSCRRLLFCYADN
jgi:hypothetical protein